MYSIVCSAGPEERRCHIYYLLFFPTSDIQMSLKGSHNCNKCKSFWCEEFYIYFFTSAISVQSRARTRELEACSTIVVFSLLTVRQSTMTECWQDHAKYILHDLELDHLSNLYRLTSPRIASKVEISNNCWDRLWLLEVNYLGHVRRKNMKRLISLDPPSPLRESNVRNLIINNLHQLWPGGHVLILETDLLFVVITLVCAGLRCEVRGPWASLLLRHCVICMADGFYLVSWRIVL